MDLHRRQRLACVDVVGGHRDHVTAGRGILVVDRLAQDPVFLVKRIVRGVLLAVDDDVLAVEQPSRVDVMRCELQDLASARRNDPLQVVRPLHVAELIALLVGPPLQDLAAVRPTFRLARVLDGLLARRRVAERIQHRPVPEARQALVLREAVVRVVRRPRGRGAVAAGTRVGER